MGENIGDLGGMLGRARRLSHARCSGKPAPVIDGLTGDQRFFLGWAQVWREKQRDDALKQPGDDRPALPGRFRVIGPLRNVDAWYDAFGVKPDNPMYIPPEKRVHIW